MPGDAVVLRDPTPHRVLRALSECAVDLADLRDPHMVLQAIVRRTRHLLGTDMAYLSLNDLELGETHIEYTDGVRTEEYRTIRMPLGTGILGSVAAGGTDARTDDYLRDASLTHLPAIDEIVRGEGVRAIHGCPVRVGGRVVAALLVAQRATIRFTSRQTTALRRMAEQVALAMQPARAELGDSLQPFADGLVERVPQGPHAVCAFVAERLGHPVELHGTDPTVDGADAEMLRTAVATSLHSGAPVVLPRARAAPVTVAAVRHSADHVATLLVPVDPLALRERGRLLLTRSLPAVGAALLAQQHVAEAEMRSGTDLVEALLRTGQLEADLLARLISLGFTRRRPTTAVVVASAERTRTAIGPVVRRVAGSAALLTSTTGERQTVLAQVPDASSFAESVHAALDGDVLLAWSVAREGLDGLASAHTAAARTVGALHALGVRRACAHPGALGPEAMVVAGSDPGLVDELITRRLRPLLEADSTGRLVETAWVVLECGGRLRESAARLHVHPNTVRQRSDRISSLLGPGWKQAPESLDTHFALRLWRVRSALGASP